MPTIVVKSYVREQPLVLVHGPIFVQIMQRVAKSLGLRIVECATGRGLTEVDGKKLRSYRLAFDLVELDSQQEVSLV